MSTISFEEVMFTILSATQDVVKNYMGLDIYAGKVASGVSPITSDIVAIIGIGGDRVGYVMIAAGDATARRVAQQMLMLDDPNEEAMRDAIGEMTNNIAGLFKNRFQEQYGDVALGLPLVVSGFVRPPADPRPTNEPGSAAEPSSALSMQFKGVTVPFRTMDDSISFRVMVLI